MNPVRKQKLLIVGVILGGAVLATALLLVAFDKGLNVFFTPTEIVEGKVKGTQNIRIGGMVKQGSLVREGLQGTRIEFIATDTNEDIPVVYTGVLPDLFREGQGLVAEGHMEAGVFHADTILAKHDENYMSAEVKSAMDAAKKKQAAKAAVSEGG